MAEGTSTGNYVLAMTLVVASTLSTSGSWANEIPHPNETQLRQQAEAIFLGEATLGPTHFTSGGYEYTSVRFRIIHRWKGKPVRFADVIVQGPIHEENSDCFRRNGLYRLYVTQTRDGRYAPVKGRYGIVSLSKSAGMFR